MKLSKDSIEEITVIKYPIKAYLRLIPFVKEERSFDQ